MLDRIYYDILIPYNPEAVNNLYFPGFCPAQFRQQLNQSILDNPDQYSLAVTRFTIPTQQIPLFIAEIQPFPNTDVGQNANPIPTVYSVTLGYNGAYSPETFVNFVSSSPNLPVSKVPTANAPNVEKLPYYYVYTYTAFLQMINDALATALNNLPGAPGGATPPYFQFEPDTSKISLVAEAQFYDIDLPNPITIYVNNALFRFVDGIQSIYRGNIGSLNTTPNGTDFQILVQDLGNNYYQPNSTAPYYPTSGTQSDYLIMTQQYQALANWNSFKNLNLVSNLIPVNKELVPSTANNTALGANQSVVNVQPVLQSFEPLIQLGPEARTTVQYQNPAQYHLIDLLSTSPLSKIDIQIFWGDTTGQLFPLFFGPGNSCSIQLMFIRKGSYYYDDSHYRVVS